MFNTSPWMKLQVNIVATTYGLFNQMNHCCCGHASSSFAKNLFLRTKEFFLDLKKKKKELRNFRDASFLS
jgi:hypothetical protein